MADSQYQGSMMYLDQVAIAFGVEDGCITAAFIFPNNPEVFKVTFEPSTTQEQAVEKARQIIETPVDRFYLGATPLTRPAPGRMLE
jgi:hypothetical protein